MGQSRVGKLYDESISYVFRHCPEKARTDCFVYFVSDGKYIKIGVAIDIPKRIKGVQTGNPHKLYLVEYMVFPYLDAAYYAEKQLHETFKDFRMMGEWFDIADCYEFLMFIRFIKHEVGSPILETHYKEFMDMHWSTSHQLRYAIYGR